MPAPRSINSFLEQAENLPLIQERLLLDDVLMPNRQAAYGRRYRFDEITSVDAYRERVPLVGYEDLRPSIERMAAGEPDILCSGRILAFFKTSGSTSKPKLVPVTRAFAAQKNRAFAVFWAYVHERFPKLKTGRLLANFGDHAHGERSAGGARILSETTFWNERMQVANGASRWPTPPSLRSIDDAALRYALAARFALNGPLHGIMCLNPSTLLALVRVLESQGVALAAGLDAGRIGDLANAAGAILDDLKEGLDRDPARAARLMAALAGDRPIALTSIWSELEVVITWCSAPVQPYLKLLQPSLAGVAHQDYVTQSSECIMALPLGLSEAGGMLAYNAHFFEFIEDDRIDEAAPETRLAHELEIGRFYGLVVSTAGGLYRYRTGDRFRIEGYQGLTPMLSFQGRSGVGSSMTGEKITEDQIRLAAERATSLIGAGPLQLLCFPRSAPLPHYGLLLDWPHDKAGDAAATWLSTFERSLASINCEYGDKRQSGRLGAPVGLPIDRDLIERYRQRIAKERRVSDAQVKIGLLTSEMDLDRNLGLGVGLGVGEGIDADR